MNNCYLIFNINSNVYNVYPAPTTFQSFFKLNNIIYGLGIDNYLYKLELKLNKIMKIFNNNELIANTLYDDYFVLSNLKFKNYNVYSEITLDNITLSSNIVSFNINPVNKISTLSGLINFGTIINFGLNTSLQYNPESTTFWYKFSNNKLNGRILEIQRINNNNLFALGSGGSINYTNNNGKDWIKLNSPTENNIYGLQFIDISNFVVICENKISRTNNFGISWYDISGLSLNTITCADVINETAYIGTNNGTIYLTTNYGNNWTSIYSAGSKIHAIQMLSKTTYVALYGTGYIVVSQNSGVTNTARQVASYQFIYLSVYDINSIL
jgi:photosystem II stability/assembly factor-like uncharacterized protein